MKDQEEDEGPKWGFLDNGGVKREYRVSGEKVEEECQSRGPSPSEMFVHRLYESSYTLISNAHGDLSDFHSLSSSPLMCL